MLTSGVQVLEAVDETEAWAEAAFGLGRSQVAVAARFGAVGYGAAPSMEVVQHVLDVAERYGFTCWESRPLGETYVMLLFDRIVEE